MLSVNWKDTRKHQINLSSAKATYAFPKDRRFKQNFSVLCDSFYNIPSNLGKAPASGMGRGNKVDLSNISIAPSPQNYNIRSDFAEPKKGGKFSLGREKMKFSGIFRHSDTPEPGHYNIKSAMNTKQGFTIYSKLAEPVFSNSKSPGPAHYKSVASLSQTGRYIISNFPSVAGYKIKESKNYDPAKSRVVPGPGYYNQEKENMNESGKYFNSRHESSRCRTFSRSANKGIVSTSRLPGPGAYNIVSEFGAKL